MKVNCKTDPVLASRPLELFIALELRRQATWGDRSVNFSQSGNEVDLLLEERTGQVATVAIKLSESLLRVMSKG